ncbi:MAG: hypothetical protein CYG61_04565 [Actinobacteria bacterium]|nr:MAG: hypothetical protein CYG61_04565 [Actinomycetota bacterium]
MTPKLWPDAPDLAELVGEPGPFVSVVLATEAEIDNASHRNQLRWRGMRDALLEQGAGEDALALVDPLVDDAHLQGQTLLVVANARGVHHRSHWSKLPFREFARWEPLPSFGAIIERRQEAPAYVLVVADRSGADLVAVRHEAADIATDAGDQDPAARKVNAGGWSQRRYQERAENAWEHNAKDVAEVTTRLVQLVDARLVLLAGDVRALQMLREEVPPGVAELVVEVDGTRAADGAPGAEPGDIEAQVAAVVAQDSRTMVEKLTEELGQDDRGCAGVSDTVAALTAAQVQVLLVRDDPDDRRTAWFGSDPSVIGERPGDLADLGVEGAQEGRLADVLIRAALATGAGVRMLDRDGDVAGGVGAILRWS